MYFSKLWLHTVFRSSRVSVHKTKQILCGPLQSKICWISPLWMHLPWNPSGALVNTPSSIFRTSAGRSQSCSYATRLCWPHLLGRSMWKSNRRKRKPCRAWLGHLQGLQCEIQLPVLFWPRSPKLPSSDCHSLVPRRLQTAPGRLRWWWSQIQVYSILWLHRPWRHCPVFWCCMSPTLYGLSLLWQCLQRIQHGPFWRLWQKWLWQRSQRLVLKACPRLPGR